MAGEISPEERLLNLIRGKSQTSSDSKVHNPPPLTPDKEAPATPEAKKSILGILGIKKFRASLREQRPVIKRPGFKPAHKVLLSLCLFLLVYLAFDYLGTSKFPEEPFIAKAAGKEDRKEETPLTLRPYSYYSREIGKRDIFRPYKEPKPALLPQLPDLKRVTLREQAANLTLRGIVLDRNPQAVIVDNKEKKTYFLNKGQFIGEIKIEDILRGKVILSRQGERLDLRL